jgi:acyl-CoA synthetase (AMP-forming)/AMP-acid ligase II
MRAVPLTPRDAHSAATIAMFYSRGYWTSETLPDILDRRAAADPDHALVIDGPAVLSNAQARETAYRVAAGLRALGVRAGDRIAVQLPNWPEYVLTYFALARLGAIVVPLLPIYRHKEVRYILGLTGASVYVGTPAGRFDHLAMVRELRADLPELKTVVAVRGPAGPVEASYEDLAAGAGVPAEGQLGPRPDADAGHLIGFTSGTESRPKGCFHTWNTYSFTARVKQRLYEVTPDDIELVVSPPTHTSGLVAGVLKPLVSGAAMCLVPDWNPQEALGLITRHRATMATGATPFISMLAEAYDPAVHDVSSFRLFLCGGAPVPAALIQRVRQTLGGTKVLSVYGQTESIILTTCVPGDGDERAASSSGRPVPGVQLSIRDSAGAPLGPGQTGEICYRTPGAMLGYWRNPEATAAASGPGGWWRSGDLGYLDEAGYLQITGRIKDMIIRGGINISSREVEEMLEEHPRVTAAAVIGVPDERLGERIGAFVVAVGAEPTLAELTAFLEERFRLARQKLPEMLYVLPELPMTATGKVSKQDLRARWGDLAGAAGQASALTRITRGRDG